MPEAPLSELISDHKHWLSEIERWEGYVQTWNQQQAALAREIETLLADHGRQLKEHAQAVVSLKRGIVECERMIAGGKCDAREAARRHSREAGLHDEQRNIHERLKRTHHTLMAGLALLKGQPFREE
jgi:septal ring factor EnvC (AmiA/AmiB activator)